MSKRTLALVILTEQKADRSYRIFYLENEYLKIGILPEIGGRIFSGMRDRWFNSRPNRESRLNSGQFHR